MHTACANGERCVAVAALGEPGRLSLANPGPECYACRERDLDGQIAPATSGQTYSLTEAADLLGVARRRVEYLIATNQLRATKVKAGRRGVWTIAESDLRALEEAS